MAVRVPGAGGDHGDLGSRRLQERFRGGGPGAVVRDLEHVHARNPSRQQLRVDALLDVAHEQEALRPHLAQQDDRDVVDRGAAIRRVLGHPAGVRPEDAKVDRVKRQSIARLEAPVRRAERGEVLCPLLVARTGTDHAGLVDPPHPVALEEQAEPGDVILVGMAEDEHVDAAVPRRQSLVQRQQEP
jgi:hypothetical protein